VTPSPEPLVLCAGCLMSTTLGPLPFLEALWPPVKARCGATALGLALEGSAARQLRLFELLNAFEVAINQRRVGERPQMLGGLEFW
jgi:hypothetical protein